MDKRAPAIDCYIQALQKSVYLVEGIDALMQHEMLMAWEEKDLIQHIMPQPQNGNEADLKILSHLYESKLKKYYTVQSQVRTLHNIYWRNIINRFFSRIIRRKLPTTRNCSMQSTRKSKKVNCSKIANQSASQHQPPSKVQQRSSLHHRHSTLCRQPIEFSLISKTHPHHRTRFSRVYRESRCSAQVEQ